MAVWVEKEFFGLSQKEEGVALYQDGGEWEKLSEEGKIRRSVYVTMIKTMRARTYLFECGVTY